MSDSSEDGLHDESSAHTLQRSEWMTVQKSHTMNLQRAPQKTRLLTGWNSLVRILSFRSIVVLQECLFRPLFLLLLLLPAGAVRKANKY